MLLTAKRQEIFEEIYRTDLVFQPDCWKLCGDAHCCSFARHKARFVMLGAKAGQELPLLPGEFDFLQLKGWTAQFQDFDRRVLPFDYGLATIALDTVTSRRPQCACDHVTRTTVCRLYPLLPVFDLHGNLVATEPVGLYEELEGLDGLEPACKITALPFAQMDLFLNIVRLLGSDPVLLFHMMAYRLAKAHIVERLAAQKNGSGSSAFRLFEFAFIRGKLIDQAALKAALANLHRSFRERYGSWFDEALAGTSAAPAG